MNILTIKLNRRIINIAAPMMLSGISIPLLGIVDSAILGHLSSPLFMGASAVGNSVLSLVFWGFAFLRMGTTSQAAQMFGRQSSSALAALLVQAMALSLLISFCLIALQPIITSSALYFIAPSSEVKDLAASYIAIRFLSTPAFLINLSLIGWCIGQQNTAIPMKVIISVNILNIIFDVIFINQLGWQSDGADRKSVV